MISQPNPSEGEQTTPQGVPDSPPNIPKKASPKLWQKNTIITDAYNSRYRIEKELGRGGLGITYLAQRMSSQENVVIKILQEKYQSRADIRQTFLNEATTLSRCNHPSIVKIHGVINIVKVDDNPLDLEVVAIVMEYIAGQNLSTYLEAHNNKLPVNQALSYIKQIAQALKIVHAQNLLHRDIKPDNIMLRNQSEAVLIDFGIAIQFEPSRIQQNPMAFTDGYAPIEQYQGVVQWGPYTDIYGLAATFYRLVTGQVPTSAKEREEKAQRGEQNTLVEPKDFRPPIEISRRINSAIVKGLGLHSRERPQQIQDWLNLLTPPKFNPWLGLVLLTLATSIYALIKNIPLYQWQVYSSPEHEFNLQHPAHWQVNVITRKDVFSPWQLEIYDPNQQERINVVVRNLSEASTVEEYCSLMIAPSLPSQSLSPQKLLLKNNRSVCLYQDQKGLSKIGTVYNYKGYEITIDSGSPHLVERVINSLEFTSPSNQE